MSKEEQDIATKAVIQELRSKYLSLITKKVNDTMPLNTRYDFNTLNSKIGSKGRGLIKLELPLSTRMPSPYLELKMNSDFNIEPTPVVENPFLIIYLNHSEACEISTIAAPISTITKTGSVKSLGGLSDSLTLEGFQNTAEHVKKLRECLASAEYQEFSYMASEEIRKEFKDCMNFNTAFYLARVLPLEVVGSNLSANMVYDENEEEYKTCIVDPTMAYNDTKKMSITTPGIKELNHIMNNSKAVEKIKSEAFKHKMGLV